MPVEEEKNKIFGNDTAVKNAAEGAIKGPSEIPSAPAIEKPPSPEKLEKIEAIPRKGVEVVTPLIRQTIEDAKKELAPPTVIPAGKTKTRVEIEKILEKDLKELYQAMSTLQRAAFKKKGEETAEQIETLMGKAKFKIRKVLRLLIDWLKLIPGVNRFFLEQEAKIKADQISALRQTLKERGEL